MNISDFKNKVLNGLRKNYAHSGNISPMFLYVTPAMEFKCFPLNEFADMSKKNLALILKSRCLDINPLFTAFVAQSRVLTIKEYNVPKMFKSDTELKYGSLLNATNNSESEPALVVAINSQDGNKILMTLKLLPESNGIELIKEVQTTDMKGILANII